MNYNITVKNDEQQINRNILLFIAENDTVRGQGKL